MKFFFYYDTNSAFAITKLRKIIIHQAATKDNLKFNGCRVFVRFIL